MIFVVNVVTRHSMFTRILTRSMGFVRNAGTNTGLKEDKQIWQRSTNIEMRMGWNH